MRSTGLADLFYRLDVNPFYVVAPLVFVIPITSFLLSLIFFGILYSFVFTLVVFLCCSVVFYLYFHWDPDREIVKDSKAILSPADGKVVYIKEIKQGEIIESVKKENRMKLTELLALTDPDVSCASGFIIGIEMRLFDVHITRCPIDGDKILDHHVSGHIVPMNNPRFEYINDRETVVIKEDATDPSSLQIAVVQIATFITRTVKSFVRDKTQLVQGEKLGIIRLGSQVDVIVFSSDITLLVKEHDRVYAGITRLAEKISV